MGRGAWQATVNEVSKSWTLLSYKHFHFLVDMSSTTDSNFSKQSLGSRDLWPLCLHLT